MKMRLKKLNLALIGFGILAFVFLFAYANPFNSLLNFLFTVKNETTAVQSVSTIRTLQAQYASKHSGKFAANFDELIKTVQLKDEFQGESPIVNDYVYKMTVRQSSGSEPDFYAITADPTNVKSVYTKSGFHYYFDSTLKTIKITEENRQGRQMILRFEKLGVSN